MQSVKSDRDRITLDSDSILKGQYLGFMRDYLVLYHMEQIPDSEVLNSRRHYLPHHDVRKNDSTTTNERLLDRVYPSAPRKNGWSQVSSHFPHVNNGKVRSPT
ncbi:hypothetical protein AVEN_271142-1 [Araneus ventricosus]|uniref:Uncharacterized protein n=1 Tax=Araneus ventricosus TaxID=182803 RepID=A0A4Y2E4Z7_ARAVE|nr:hypothetical protein AVEN_271142-1 [Araneus ventricosus]